MKKLTALILVAGLTAGCTSQQMYNIPSGKTKADFIEVREECTRSSGYADGSFLFGPAIIVAPIAIAMAINKRSQQSDFETCMIANGYTCNSGCLNTNAQVGTTAIRPEVTPDSVNKMIAILEEKGFSDYYVGGKKSRVMINKQSIKIDGNLCVIKTVTMYENGKNIKIKLSDAVTYNVAYQTNDFVVDIKGKRFKLMAFNGYDSNNNEIYSHINTDMEITTGEITSMSPLDYYLKMYVPDYNI